MNSDPSSAPAPASFEQLCSMLLRLVMMLWVRDTPQARLFRQFRQRIDVITDRIAALAARVRAGHTPKPGACAGEKHAPKLATPRSAAGSAAAKIKFPREYGWLADQFGLCIGLDGDPLLIYIQRPETQALMAADPRIGDLLRELLYACGLLDEAEPFLPPTRAERTRLAHAAEPAVETAPPIDAEPAIPPSPDPISDPTPPTAAGAAPDPAENTQNSGEAQADEPADECAAEQAADPPVFAMPKPRPPSQAAHRKPPARPPRPHRETPKIFKNGWNAPVFVRAICSG